MRLAALTLLIIGNLLAIQVYAQDVSPQPLTRVDCGKAQMAWDENANVCIADSGNVSRQPLTRLDCENAAWLGMTLPMYAEKRLKLRRNGPSPQLPSRCPSQS